MKLNTRSTIFQILVALTILQATSQAAVIDFYKNSKTAGENRYFIEMISPKTTEKLCKQDDKVRSASGHIRDGINKYISFDGFEGFAGHFSKDVIQRLANNPLVSRITPDIILEALDEVKVQAAAPLHLVRLSQEGPVQSGDSEYYYDANYQGDGVLAYVIDTGVLVEHPQFEGRAFTGPNYSDDARNIDYVGHGTHVAGIIGSKTYGVAKKIEIISVKVLDRYGQGTLSSVIAGIEYAVNHRIRDGRPGVANLSLGAAKSPILDDAVKAAYDAGLFMVVAAGNSNLDACNTSPAGSKYAYTVGAIDDTKDRIASFSNWGKCVNIFASGLNVESLSNNPRDYSERQYLSGTSMASPVITGLIGIELEKGTELEEISERLDENAIFQAIPRISIVLRPGSPNKIASNGIRESDYEAARFMSSNSTLSTRVRF